jgi:hypothetical protein
MHKIAFSYFLYFLRDDLLAKGKHLFFFLIYQLSKFVYMAKLKEDWRHRVVHALIVHTDNFQFGTSNLAG